MTFEEKPYTKLVSVRLPTHINDGLEEYAKKFKQTKTALIIEAVAGWLLMLRKEGR